MSREDIQSSANPIIAPTPIPNKVPTTGTEDPMAAPSATPVVVPNL